MPAATSAPPNCAGCKMPILEGGMITFGDASSRYHERCFVCNSCSTSLSTGTAVHAHANKPYCGACWTAKFAERCGECSQPFAGKQRVIAFNGKKLHTTCFVCNKCGECLGDGSRKYVSHADDAYCSPCYADAFGPKCGACGQPLGEGKYIVHKGRKLHRQCFACAACKTSLAGGTHYEKDGKIYCEADYTWLFGVVCSICSARLLTWLTAPTGEHYCRHHERDSPPCHGCGRLVGKASGGSDLSDGRVACRECAATAVHSLEAATSWYRLVRSFLASRGVPGLPDAGGVRLVLCDRSELLARNGRHLATAHHAHKCPVGLTSAEELQTVNAGSGKSRGSKPEAAPHCHPTAGSNRRPPNSRIKPEATQLQD